MMILSEPVRRLDLLPLESLRPHPKNPRTHRLGELRKSFDQFGFTNPPLICERTGLLAADLTDGVVAPPRASKATKPAAAPAGSMQAAAARLKAAGRYSGVGKITITKENAAKIVAASDAEIAAWVIDTPAKPATAPRSSEVTPITKASQTRRTAKAS